MYNPMNTARFIHYLDNDETKGRKEQELINLQRDTIERLEDDIREAKVGLSRGVNQ